MSWSQILTWLRQCEQQHGRCKGPLKTERRLPTRLLDLGTGKSRKGLRLCTTHGLPQDTRYMTLSHRWGGEQAARLLLRNLDAFMESIEEASLPSTFREAIMITRRLEIRYLWIDSICIRQDTDDFRCAEALVEMMMGGGEPEWFPSAFTLERVFTKKTVCFRAWMEPEAGLPSGEM